jgi:adenylate cyclase
MMLTTCIVLALASAAFVAHEMQVARGAMAGELRTLADAIGTNIVSALTFNDPAAARDTLAALRSSRSVAAGFVLKPNGEVFARYVRPDADAAVETRPDSAGAAGPPEPLDLRRARSGGYETWGDQLVLVRPIVLEGDAVGLIYIGATFDELRKATARLFVIVGTIAAGLCALAFVLAYRLQRVISGPIVRLISTIRQVSRTKNYSLRAERTSDDELGVLIDGFNAMLAQVAERDQQLREEVQILELSQDLARELSLDVLLSRIMHATTELLNADRSTLFLYDRKTNELFSRIAEGLEIKEIRIPSDSGIAGTVFTTRATVNITDPYHDPRFNPEVDRRTGYHTESILAMPIINKAGECIGVTEVLNRKGGAFTAKDEARLGAFSAQVTIAADNAKLFESVLNEKRYNDSILRSTSDGIITLDADDVILTANEAALQILKVTRDAVVQKPVGAIFVGPNAWVLKNLDKVKQTGHREITVEKELWLGEHETASVNLAVNPLIDTSEEPIGSMIVVEDITSEKRMKSTMARYMSPEVAEQLLAGGEAVLGGKDQTVSILFSDIRNFTTMSEALGARETVAMLNAYFERMVDVIVRNRGVLDKFIGDAVMALFGVPFNGPHDADDAVRVANSMFIALRELNRERRQQGMEPIDIGVGISTGVVVVGNIGSTKRMEYTVIGDSVNLASRLESATKFYGTRMLLSEFTWTALRDRGLLREIDRLRVKGKHEPVAIYEAMDHFTDEIFPNLMRTVTRYNEGIQHYRARDWKDALGCFQEALELNPGDRPSQLYVERCEHFLATPPPADWDGVWTMTTK